MPLPAQFQLGLELTNIVNPLSQAIGALGSLALVSAIQKAGSDVITEIKLASLIGRHRIDEVIKFHFRAMVAKADQTVISKYIDILLESGSGPTVQEAMKNPALFSMVIQLSALAFAHEDEKLANAMVEAIERIVKESGAKVEMVPDYVSLLGTLRACQQQTAAFRWADLYESVERIIEDTLKTPEQGKRTRCTAKRQKVNKLLIANLESVTLRALPFPVLQSLIMWLQSLQSLPEHRLLYLRCNTGISTVVVWCHHVLGLTVSVSLQGSEITFGKGTTNVLVEESKIAHAGASLMDPADQYEPLFTLASDESNPTVHSENRAEAYGFGMTALKYTKVPDGERQYCSHWVIARALSSISEDPPGSSHISTKAHPNEDTSRSPALESGNPSRERIIQAGQFLFALDKLDFKLIDSCINLPPKRARSMNQVNWTGLVAILVTFARIRNEDLQKCTALPLSLYAHQGLQKVDHGMDKTITNSTRTRPLDLVGSFKVLSRLLLGHMYSEDYVQDAILVSAWGWSIFFEFIDAIDPAEVSTDAMRVVYGVPTRRGLRRTRIIDGPTQIRMSFTTGEILRKDPGIVYYPGVGSATRGQILVGHQADAFQVTLTFNWKSMNKTDKHHKLGFREMQELCGRAERLAPCQHPSNDENDRVGVDTWIDSLSDGSRNGDKALMKKSIDVLANSSYEIKWPKDKKGRNNSIERVIVRHYTTIPEESPKLSIPHSPDSLLSTEVWYFYVSDNPDARWLQLDDLCNSTDEGAFSLVMRGRETCVACAVKNQMKRGTKPILVLL